MEAVFEHITEVRYLLAQIFEIGFASARNMADQLEESAETADQCGMTGGAYLIREIAKHITRIAAGEGSIRSATMSFCNVLSYYTIIADSLTLETMSKNPAETI